MNRRTCNARCVECDGKRSCSSDASLRPGEEPPLASHLATPRALYNHHGIYVGGGRVIHYAGLAYGFRRGPVEDVPLEQFARGRDVRIRRGVARFDRREVVERARSRLGEGRYRLLSNNCEHFCTWALYGRSRSDQLDRLCALPRAAWNGVRTLIEHGFHLLTHPRASSNASMWSPRGLPPSARNRLIYWNRPDAAELAGLYTMVSPNYRTVMKSYAKAQEVARAT